MLNMKRASAKIFCNINRLAVKSLLAGRDLTASYLAQQLGISIPYMSEILRGTRNAAKYVNPIAKVLKVPIDTILLKPKPTRDAQHAQHAA